MHAMTTTVTAAADAANHEAGAACARQLPPGRAFPEGWSAG